MSLSVSSASPLWWTNHCCMMGNRRTVHQWARGSITIVLPRSTIDNDFNRHFFKLDEIITFRFSTLYYGQLLSALSPLATQFNWMRQLAWINMVHPCSEIFGIPLDGLMICLAGINFSKCSRHSEFLLQSFQDMFPSLQFFHHEWQFGIDYSQLSLLCFFCVFFFNKHIIIAVKLEHISSHWRGTVACHQRHGGDNRQKMEMFWQCRYQIGERELTEVLESNNKVICQCHYLGLWSDYLFFSLFLQEPCTSR